MKDLLRHLFFPRESNNHRSKLLHHSSLLMVIALLLVGSLSLSFIQTHTSGVLGISTNISVDELLSLTNQVRAEKGLGALQMSSELSSAATNKAADMFAKNYWAHNAPDGTPPWVFFKSAGYDYVYAGENLARGFRTAKEVVDAWMASPGHRENLLSANYKEIGFAIQTGSLTGEDTALVVQEFGSRNSVKVANVPLVQTTVPSPTLVVTQQTRIPIPVPSVTILSPTLVPTIPPQITQTTEVAALQSQPLVNKPTITRNIAFILLGLFISLLLLDMIVVEKNNIIRFVGHNIDHIIFLAVLLALVMIVTRGAIL